MLAAEPLAHDWDSRCSPCVTAARLTPSPLASAARDSYKPSDSIRCQALARSPGIGPPRLVGATLGRLLTNPTNLIDGSFSVRAAEAV